MRDGDRNRQTLSELTGGQPPWGKDGALREDVGQTQSAGHLLGDTLYLHICPHCAAHLQGGADGDNTEI